MAIVCGLPATADPPSFAALVRYPAGDFTTAIDVTDFNDDGLVDVVVASRKSSTVTIYAGDGSGLLTEAVVSVGDGPRSVTAADFDGDGDIDFATANRFGNSVSLVTQGEDGTFTVSEAASISTAWWLTSTDVDGDDDVDILVAMRTTPSEIAILRNDGSGTFVVDESPTRVTADGSRYGALGDVNGDGAEDLLVANLLGHSLSVFLHDGVGDYLSPITIDMPGGPRGVAIDDLDGDGDADLAVVLKDSETVQLLFGDGTGAFVADARTFEAFERAHAIAIDDLDNDGDADIVACSVGGPSIVLLENDGTGGMTRSLIAGLPGASDIVTTDLNADGAIDLLVANKNDGCEYFRNRMTETGPCVADINDDGQVGFADLIATLSAWGPCSGTPCVTDFDEDTLVGFSDVLFVLSGWGQCD